MAPCNGTQQRHPAMAPRPLPPKFLVVTSPTSTTIAHSMAPYDGTQQRHHVHSPKVGRHPQWHPMMAPSNGTTSRAAMDFWCHVQSAKVVRRPSPLLEVRTPIRTPIAIAIWGKKSLGCTSRLPCGNFIPNWAAICFSLGFPDSILLANGVDALPGLAKMQKSAN